MGFVFHGEQAHLDHARFKGRGFELGTRFEGGGGSARVKCSYGKWGLCNSDDATGYDKDEVAGVGGGGSERCGGGKKFGERRRDFGLLQRVGTKVGVHVHVCSRHDYYL